VSAKLAAKMVLAMKEIDAVLKLGRNDFQKYNYVRAADVANEVRKAIIAHGIAFTYDVVDVQHWEANKEGKSTNYFCQLTVNTTFTDTESGEQLSGKVVGWGTDTLDKAPYKAMTGALKYALRMNFLIPDESDPENDSNGNTGNGNGHQDTQRAARPVSPTTPENYDAEPAYDNEYDAHMETPAPQVRKQGPVITEAQAKRFFGIAMGAGKTKQQINNYVASKGYGHSSEFLKSEYETHCEWAASK
jgi:hypothetical protein